MLKQINLTKGRRNQKQSGPEVKTFPVPFSSDRNQGNTTINTNFPSKNAKEQIINQAFKFHSQGNISEAAKYYQYFIDQGFKDHRVFTNYGTILKDLGKLKEAEDSQRKAIEIKPDYAIAYSNLGAVLQSLGKLKEAEFSIRKAIDIKPDYAEPHSNLGLILKDLGKLKEAEVTIRKAIEIKPYYADAHYNLGNVLINLGKSKEAFNTLMKVIEINPSHFSIYPRFTRFLKDSDPSQFDNSELKNILNILLKKNNVAHNELFNSFKYLYRNELINNLEIIEKKFSQIKLLLNDEIITNALNKIIFKDYKLEQLLTKIRKSICCHVANNPEDINYSELEFIIALATQCFLNEYVYLLSEEESLYIDIIMNKCKNIELNEKTISILACYFPLYKLIDQIPLLKSFNSTNKSFIELTKLQISEPLKEVELSKSIKKLGQIKNNISQQVKSQYEENPYPRWRYGNYLKNQKISIEQVINDEISPNHINKVLINKKPKVLVAGCGTGQQILHTQIYKNAQVTCIDLSLSSLSYAKRKTNEMGINNVELIQMDLLEVGLLEEKFDIILCSGVLHHMDNPSNGLKALLSALKSNGLLKLGLYSELARQDVVKARNYISSKNFQRDDNNIRNFRQKVFSNELNNLESLMTFGDFYSLSECRDLCFHAQEYRFTISQIQDTLKSNGLNFLGFLLQQPIKSLYKKYFPKDTKQTNLQNWAKFEEKYPNTFRAMYQFWVCKNKN